MNRNTGLRRGWHWRHRESGVSGIEAGILLPLIVFMIFGFFELYQYHRTVAVLDRAAFTVANSVSMQPELFDRNQCTKSDDICTYGTIVRELMEPLDYQRNGRMLISVYATETAGRGAGATVQWKNTPEWQRGFRGSVSGPAIASRLQDKTIFPPPRVGDTLATVEIFYDYDPFVISSRFWATLGGTREIYSRFFFRPRFSDLQYLQP